MRLRGTVVEKLSPLANEISKFHCVKHSQLRVSKPEIQWAEARNTYLIDHARANHFRIGIDQYLMLQTRPFALLFTI